MAQRHRGRTAEKRSLLEEAGEDSPESGVLEDCCRWPMLLMGQKAQVSQSAQSGHQRDGRDQEDDQAEDDKTT